MAPEQPACVQESKEAVEVEQGRAAALQLQCQAGSAALADERAALDQDRLRLQVREHKLRPTQTRLLSPCPSETWYACGRVLVGLTSSQPR